MIRRLVTFFRILSLGATLGDRLLLAWCFVASRLGRGPVTANLSVAGKRFPVIISGPADRTVLREVFLDSEYGRATLPEPRTVVDVGANVGMASLYFAARFPDARIHAIEPCPNTFERLKQNTAAFPNITAHNLAISSANGEATFYVNAAHFGSSLRSRNTAAESEVQVKTMTMNAFLDQVGLDKVGLLKFDIEGNEAEMMRGLDVGRVGQFIGELHFDLMEEPIEWFEERLSGRRIEIAPLSRYRSVILAS